MATSVSPHPAGAAAAPAVGGRGVQVAVGLVAVIVPLLYIASDAFEVVQGGHTTTSLVLTYLGEAPAVFYILGLYQVQRPRIGLMGLVGAVLYGYAFIFWSGFTLYGLLTHAPDLPALADAVGPWYWVHAVVQTIGGLLFAGAVWKAGILPQWTAVLLLGAMVGHVLLSMTGLPESYRWVTSTAQNAAFVAMGMAVLRKALGRDRGGG